MRKIIISICLIFVCTLAFADNNQQKLLASYSSQGIYYYYMPNFDIKTFKKPKDVKPVDSNYIIFIYAKDISSNNFSYRDEIKIENDPGYLFEMMLVGIKNEPTFFVNKTTKNGEDEVSICELKKDNWQVKYILNPKTNKFEKQVIFNNGKLGITSICNPNYIPFQDI